MIFPSFVIFCRNKERYVDKAIQGALSQTVPCEIVIADFDSSDSSREVIQMSIKKSPRGAEHEVKYLPVDTPTKSTMREMNKNLAWLHGQTKGEWIFESSADDYSLPNRVQVCMEAVVKLKDMGYNLNAISCAQYFEEDGVVNRECRTGYPQESSFIKPGDGLSRLVYGSTIAGYKRSFLEKVGDCGNVTPDVLRGWLAAFNEGHYYVNTAAHCHVNVSDINNTGMGGRLAAAEGDESLRLQEMNHWQLCRMYVACFTKAQAFFSSTQSFEATAPEDLNAVLNAIINQAICWVQTRDVLKEQNIIPGVNA